ncbi:MAG: Uma2 family endonuclease [Bacteroidota bacterium]
MKAHKLPKLSIQEYLQQELEKGIKYEYHNGEIYALAGSTLNHGLICGNAYSTIRTGLEQQKSNCIPLNSEIKLYIKASNSFVYPDTMVICGGLDQAKEESNAICNPTLIIEVLSKSTAVYDRGDKFHLYRSLPSFSEYVLIEQDRAIVDVHFKPQGSDLWKITRYQGMDQAIQLESIGLAISMRELYTNTDLADKSSHMP